MPEVAADVASLSWLESSLDYAPIISIDCVYYEVDFLPLMDVGVAVWGVELYVGNWLQLYERLRWYTGLLQATLDRLVVV